MQIVRSFQVLLVFYQPYSLHLVRRFFFFQSTVFCVFGCIFHLGVVPNTEFRAHSRKLSLQKLPRMTKKG